MQVSDRHEGRVHVGNINAELGHGPAFLRGGREFPVRRVHHDHVVVIPEHPLGREAESVTVDDFVVKARERATKMRQQIGVHLHTCDVQVHPIREQSRDHSRQGPGPSSEIQHSQGTRPGEPETGDHALRQGSGGEELPVLDLHVFQEHRPRPLGHFQHRHGSTVTASTDTTSQHPSEHPGLTTDGRPETAARRGREPAGCKNAVTTSRFSAPG